jgi:K+-transporting ATPase ATPase C chain
MPAALSGHVGRSTSTGRGHAKPWPWRPKSGQIPELTLTVLTGVIYPAAITIVAQLVFPRQANGSLVKVEDRTVGSELIGQPFDDAKYFWSRPSATSPAYNGGASSGSNLGPTNPALLDAVKGRVETLKKADPSNALAIPVDLVTASGSGLDPHISPAAAMCQIPRIGRVRGMEEAAIRQLVSEHIEDRQFGFLGEARVNVLLLNLSLDQAAASK